MEHPCIGFFPALPLQNNLDLGDWVVGSPSEDTPWRSERFKELVDKLLGSFTSDEFGDNDAHTCAQLIEKLVPDMGAGEGARGLVVIRYSDCIAEGTEGLRGAIGYVGRLSGFARSRAAEIPRPGRPRL